MCIQDMPVLVNSAGGRAYHAQSGYSAPQHQAYKKAAGRTDTRLDELGRQREVWSLSNPVHELLQICAEVFKHLQQCSQWSLQAMRR